MSGPRSVRIALALALLAVSTSLTVPPRAPAAAGSSPSAGGQGYARVADRAARAWRKLQYRRGAFFDPYTREKSRGYGVAMIGYAMMQAGLRAGEPKLIAAGARAVADETKTPAKAGVFDQWIAPIAYELARGRLRREPAARALRNQLRPYLATLGEPRLGPGGGRCFTSPTCFSNHKIVQAEAKLELAASGLRRDAGALRAAGRNVVGPVAATATGRSGRASGPGPRRGLGVLSDTGVWPLGYHALSAMMLARAAWGERTRLPRVLRDNLEHALDTLVAYAAPDGDVGFLGARQEQAWIPAATAYASEVGARIFARERGRSARYAALADRALERVERTYARSPSGVLAPVPRLRRPGGYAQEGDDDALSANGLALAALALAADVARRPRPVPASALPADGPSWYVEPRGPAFAATRRGSIWFAVRRQPRILRSGRVPDVRFDFGVIALKQRTVRGSWREVLPHRYRRAFELTSLGPRLQTAQGIGLPVGTRISARAGAVTVTGGFLTQTGIWLRRGVRFRFAATPRGVRLTFPALAGDRLEFTVLVRGRARRATRGIADAQATTSFRPAPSIAVDRSQRVATCCDRAVIPATATVAPDRDATVAMTIASRTPSPTGAAGRVASAGLGARTV